MTVTVAGSKVVNPKTLARYGSVVRVPYTGTYRSGVRRKERVEDKIYYFELTLADVRPSLPDPAVPVRR